MTVGSTHTVLGTTKRHSIQSIWWDTTSFAREKTSRIWRRQCTSCELYPCYYWQWKHKGVGISPLAPLHWKWDCDYQKGKKEKSFNALKSVVMSLIPLISLSERRKGATGVQSALEWQLQGDLDAELRPAGSSHPRREAAPTGGTRTGKGKVLGPWGDLAFSMWLSGYHQIQAWPHGWPAREGAQGPALMRCSAIVILKFLILHSIMHWARRIMQLVLTKYVSFLKESLLCCWDVWTRYRVW